MTTRERIKWNLISPVLNVIHEGEFKTAFKLTEVYEDFETMTEVQQMVIVYGVKQNLSDKIANMGSYTLDEKIKVMNNRFQSLVDGIWKSPSKEKASVKKEAAKLVASGELNEVELALLEKLGLK